MSVAAPAEAAPIGVYRTGDQAALPGEPGDQRRVQSDFRLALESVIKSVLRSHGREGHIEGPRPMEAAGEEYEVFAYPPFESPEQVAEVGRTIQERMEEVIGRWQSHKLRELGATEFDPAVVEHFDTFVPADNPR